VYQHILKDGTQQQVIAEMQPRMELYDYLGYHDYEQQLDRLFAEKSSD
jgi:methylisocitrate lyase